MLNTILSWFGLGKKRPGTGPSGVPKYTKKNVRPSQYYRRGGSYYSAADDSLIEDLLLIAILTEYYDDGMITESYAEPAVGDVDSVDTEPTIDIWKEEPEEDILDMDVSDTPVVSAEEASNWKVEVPAEEYVEPATYTPDPEPTKSSSYSSGYSDSDSSSSYDSGGGDCGGCGGD